MGKLMSECSVTVLFMLWLCPCVWACDTLSMISSHMGDHLKRQSIEGQMMQKKTKKSLFFPPLGLTMYEEDYRMRLTDARHVHGGQS